MNRLSLCVVLAAWRGIRWIVGRARLGVALGDRIAVERIADVVARGERAPLDLSDRGDRARLIEAARLGADVQGAPYHAAMVVTAGGVAALALLPGWIAAESELARFPRDAGPAAVAALRLRLTRTARAQLLLGSIGCAIGAPLTASFLAVHVPAGVVVSGTGLAFATAQLSIGVASLVLRSATVAGGRPRVVAAPTLRGVTLVFPLGPGGW